MVNSKSQLITSATILLLLMFPYPSHTKEWVPTSPQEIVLKYNPEILTQLPSNQPSTKQVPELLKKVEGLIATSKYPGQSDKLLQAKKFINPVSKQQSKLTSEQLDKYYLLQANIAQSQHKFTQALSLLSKINPESHLHPQSLLIQSRVHLLQGQFESTEYLCKKLLSHHIQAAELCLLDAKLSAALDSEVLDSKAVDSRTLDSSIEQAIELLNKRYKQQDTELSYYFHQIAGSFYRLKANYSKAQYFFEHNLEKATVAQWYQWADMAIANNKPRLVYKKIKSLQGSFNNSETLEDGLLIRLARAEKAITNDDSTQSLAQQRIELRERRNDKLHAADMAYYYLYVLPNPELALKWSELNWNHVKEANDRELLEHSRELN